MMARISLIALALTGCVIDPPSDENAAPPAPAPPPKHDGRDVDWLPGFAAVATSPRRIERVEDVLGPGRADCPTGDTRAISIAADVAPTPGRETIVASIAHGLVVVDGAHHRIATAALDCGGSADSIDAVELGRIDAVGPVIAVLATTGGHRMATTAITLFRVDVGPSGRVTLPRVMSAPIIERDGDATWTGGLDVTEDGLTYRDPDGGITEWTFDRDAGRFVVDRAR